ncbi:MAG: hypothetical protein ACI9KE_001197, partial [Polyangiales bacterium]
KEGEGAAAGATGVSGSECAFVCIFCLGHEEEA